MSRFSRCHQLKRNSVWSFPIRPLLEELKCRLSQAEQKSLRESSAGMYTKKRLPDGRVRVTGGKRLKESGAYTPEFGKRVAQLFKKGAVACCSLSVPILFFPILSPVHATPLGYHTWCKHFRQLHCEVSASHLAAQRQRSLWKLEGPKGFDAWM
jgi:hypothetical protein